MGSVRPYGINFYFIFFPSNESFKREKGIWRANTTSKPFLIQSIQCFSALALVPDIGLIVNFSLLLLCSLLYIVLSDRLFQVEKINLFWI